MLATAVDGHATEHLREAVILAACILCPQVVEPFESGLESMACAGGDHAVLRDLVLRHAAGGSDVLRAEIIAALGGDALESLLAQSHVAITPCIRKPGDAAITTMTIAEELAKLAAVRGLKDEVDDAADDLSGEADEGVTWRLAEAARAADMAHRAGHEDKAEYMIADNGARLDRSEVAKSRSFFDQIDFSKGGKKRH
jgi:DNA primase